MKMRTKDKIILRNVLGIVLLLALMVLTASCQKPERCIGPQEKVTIGVASVSATLPLIVAQEKGYFSDGGIDVTFKFYPSGKKAMEGMFAGEADIATSAETPILHNSLLRDDFVIFATFAYSDNDSKFLGKKDKGVSKPSELKGKKIGTVVGTGAHFFAHIYLAEHSIDLSAVTIVDIAPADLIGALKDGKVDALVVWEPIAYQVKKALSDKVVRLPQSDLYKETFSLEAMRSYANGHPGGLIKILKAVDRATIFIKQNKKESLAIVTKVLKLDEDVLTSTWDDFVFELSLEHSLLIILEDEARWAIANKFTNKTKVPNYLGYFYLDAMKVVKPEAVTIIK